MAATAPPLLALRRRAAAAATRPLVAPLLLLLLLIAATAQAAASSSPPSDLLDAAAALAPWIVSVRRQLHAIPELMWEEAKTSAAIAKHLDDLKIPFKRYAKTGLVGTVGTGKPPIVALRSDIDALPVDEPEGLEFRSGHEGRMHACGHDGKA
jgi:IAA-amino acid hydrolase